MEIGHPAHLRSEKLANGRYLGQKQDPHHRQRHNPLFLCHMRLRDCGNLAKQSSDKTNPQN
jgi:hypothetical protein